MSIRTAIEINHDYHTAQNGDVDMLWELLMDAVYHRRDRESWEKLRPFGIHKIYDCHHSHDRLEAHKLAEDARAGKFTRSKVLKTGE